MSGDWSSDVCSSDLQTRNSSTLVSVLAQCMLSVNVGRTRTRFTTIILPDFSGQKLVPLGAQRQLPGIQNLPVTHGTLRLPRRKFDTLTLLSIRQERAGFLAPRQTPEPPGPTRTGWREANSTRSSVLKRESYQSRYPRGLRASQQASAVRERHPVGFPRQIGRASCRERV